MSRTRDLVIFYHGVCCGIACGINLENRTLKIEQNEALSKNLFFLMNGIAKGMNPNLDEFLLGEILNNFEFDKTFPKFLEAWEIIKRGIPN